MINYLTIGINPPPLDKKIIIKKDAGVYTYDDKAQIVTLYGDAASIEWHCEQLIADGFSLWAEV
jgi:hypothetical protein